MTDWFDDVIEETAVAQGLPSTVDDEGALDRLATLLASATPGRSSAVRRGAAGRPGIGAAGTTRNGGVRGSAPTTAARAGQPSGSSAPARSKTRKKAGTAATVPALNTSTPVQGVRRQA